MHIIGHVIHSIVFGSYITLVMITAQVADSVFEEGEKREQD